MQCGIGSTVQDKNNDDLYPKKTLPVCQYKGDGGSGFTSHCQIMANGWGKNNMQEGKDLSVYNDDYRCGTDGSAYSKWKGKTEDNPYYNGKTTGAYTFCDGLPKEETKTPGCILNNDNKPLDKGFYKCSYNWGGDDGDRCEPDSLQQCQAPCEKIFPDDETKKNKGTYPNDEDNRSKFWWAKHGCYDESYSNNNPDKPWQDKGCGKPNAAPQGGGEQPCCVFKKQITNPGARNQCEKDKGQAPASCGLEPNIFAGYYSPNKTDDDKKNATFWPEQKRDGIEGNKLYPNGNNFPIGKDSKTKIPNRVQTYRDNIKNHIDATGLLCKDKIDPKVCFPNMDPFEPKMANSQNEPDETIAIFADNKFAERKGIKHSSTQAPAPAQSIDPNTK